LSWASVALLNATLSVKKLAADNALYETNAKSTREVARNPLGAEGRATRIDTLRLAQDQQD
jgi:hypothetical protein